VDRPTRPVGACRADSTWVGTCPEAAVDDERSYVSGGGHDNRIFLAAFLELLLIIANVGSAVVPYPLLKRQSEGCALGFVAARIMESTFISSNTSAASSIDARASSISPLTSNGLEPLTPSLPWSSMGGTDPPRPDKIA
jgi:hypothetical protein